MCLCFFFYLLFFFWGGGRGTRWHCSTTTHAQMVVYASSKFLLFAFCTGQCHESMVYVGIMALLEAGSFPKLHWHEHLGGFSGDLRTAHILSNQTGGVSVAVLGLPGLCLRFFSLASSIPTYSCIRCGRLWGCKSSVMWESFLSHSSFSIAAAQRYLCQESHRVIGCPPKHVISADASSSGQAGSGTKEPKAQTKRKAFGPGVDISSAKQSPKLQANDVTDVFFARDWVHF